MTRVVVVGRNSNISKSFINTLPAKEDVELISLNNMSSYYYSADKFLFCVGMLQNKQESEQSSGEIQNSIYYNYSGIVYHAETILDTNPYARICIIGSHSGYKGSYDGTYARCKKLLHLFIESRKLLHKDQQLVGIAPSIISDAGMTIRRKDVTNLINRETEHPMKRFIFSEEVGELIYTLLFEQPYINRTVIRMHGGDV